MPVRTYTGAEIVGWTAAEFNIGLDSLTADDLSPGVTTASGSANRGDTGGTEVTLGEGANAGVNGNAGAGGTWDFTDLPVDAIITNIRFACDIAISASGVGDGDAESDGGENTTSASASINIDAQAGVLNCGYFVPITASDSQSDPGQVLFSQSQADFTESENRTHADAVEYDFGGVPISRQDLIDSYSAISAFIIGTISINGTVATCVGPNPNWQVNAQFLISCNFDNLELQVTYSSPDSPDVEITGDGGYDFDGGELYWGNDVTGDGGYEYDGGGATFYIVSPNISGIYILVPGKRDDTWYDRSGTTGATIDVMIPRPFVDLAFLPEE